MAITEAHIKYQNPTHVVLDPADNFTAKASGAIAGGRFVQFTAGGRSGQPVVKQAAAGSVSEMVSKYDANADDTIGILTGGHVAVTAGENLVAGDAVTSDAQGRAVKIAAGQVAIGEVYTDAVTGDPVYLQF